MASVLTLLALPVLLNESRSESTPAVAGAGVGTDLSAPLRSSASTTVAPGFLGTDVTTAPPPSENQVAVPAPEQGDLARASYGPIRVSLPSPDRVGCETSWVRSGVLLLVTNVNNGHSVVCVTVARMTEPGLVMKLDATGFVQLADLVESPITVRVRCEKPGATPVTGCQ